MYAPSQRETTLRFVTSSLIAGRMHKMILDSSFSPRSANYFHKIGKISYNFLVKCATYHIEQGVMIMLNNLSNACWQTSHVHVMSLFMMDGDHRYVLNLKFTHPLFITIWPFSMWFSSISFSQTFSFVRILGHKQPVEVLIIDKLMHHLILL